MVDCMCDLWSFKHLKRFNKRCAGANIENKVCHCAPPCSSLVTSTMRTACLYSVLALMAATQRQAATSGVFLSRFHFGLLSKKHASRDAYNPLPSPPQFPPPTFQREGGEVGEGGKEREGEKDHPHWDHSPWIRPFHTLWTWNNQGLIAAVCLRRPWLKARRLTVLRPDRLQPQRGERHGQDWGCSRGHISKTHTISLSPATLFFARLVVFLLQRSWREGSLLQIAHVRVWYLNLFWFSG